MPMDLSQTLVIGISSRALFDLSAEDTLFRTEGVDAYERFQMEHENEPLEPGCALPLVKALLGLNRGSGEDGTRRQVEVVVMSRNSMQAGLRIFNAIDRYGLDITRAAFSCGAVLAPYLHGFHVDLFLSPHEEDVQAALDSGVAAAILHDKPDSACEEIEQIRIAFDGDAVLFSDEAEQVFAEHGLEAFQEHERLNAHLPLTEGPFARVLRLLSDLQSDTEGGVPPVRTALVTARNSPSHERVIRTLRAWNVRIDEAFFLGGVPKAAILSAFRPHMFFDDQATHTNLAARFVPTARVPSRLRK